MGRSAYLWKSQGRRKARNGDEGKAFADFHTTTDGSLHLWKPMYKVG
jgi:hypothetical protein